MMRHNVAHLNPATECSHPRSPVLVLTSSAAFRKWSVDRQQACTSGSRGFVSGTRSVAAPAHFTPLSIPLETATGATPSPLAKPWRSSWYAQHAPDSTASRSIRTIPVTDLRQPCFAVSAHLPILLCFALQLSLLPMPHSKGAGAMQGSPSARFATSLPAVSSLERASATCRSSFNAGATVGVLSSGMGALPFNRFGPHARQSQGNNSRTCELCFEHSLCWLPVAVSLQLTKLAKPGQDLRCCTHASTPVSYPSLL